MAGLTTASSTLGGVASGAAIGSSFAPGLGTAIGGFFGGLLGLVSGAFQSSSEDKMRELREQQLRDQTMAGLGSNYDAAQSLFVSQDAEIRQLQYNNSQLSDYMNEYAKAYQQSIASNFETGLSQYRQLMSNFTSAETSAAAMGHIGGSSGLVVEQYREDVQRYVGADMLLDENGGLFGQSMQQLFEKTNQLSKDASQQFGINNEALYGNAETGDIGLLKAHDLTAEMRTKYRSEFFAKATRAEEDEFLATRGLTLSADETKLRETVSEQRTADNGDTVKLYGDDYWQAFDSNGNVVASGEGKKGYNRHGYVPVVRHDGDDDDDRTPEYWTADEIDALNERASQGTMSSADRMEADAAWHEAEAWVDRENAKEERKREKAERKKK